VEPDEVTLRPNGRWAGRLTNRPLPEQDEEIDRLEAEERALIAEVWTGRAASERRVADAFVIVREALKSLDADPVLIELADRAVDDEMRHTELSRLVASRYAQREIPPAPLLPLSVPRHERAGDRLRHVLHVVGQCCLNETIASSFLETTLAEARTPLATSALRELLSDEVDHGRLGWALLGSLDDTTRREVEPWLPSMAIANLRMWRTAPRPYPEGATLAAHGLPSEALVEAALLRAFRDLILPGFEHLAMDTTKLRAWLDAG
jgi:hypothetical protein